MLLVNCKEVFHVLKVNHTRTKGMLSPDLMSILKQFLNFRPNSLLSMIPSIKLNGHSEL